MSETKKHPLITVKQFRELCLKRCNIPFVKSLFGDAAYEAIWKRGDNIAYVEKPSVTMACSAVMKNGLSLRFIPDELKTEEVCLLAIEQNPMAIKYIPTSKQTSKIVLTAINKNADTLKYTAASIFDILQEELMEIHGKDIWSSDFEENKKGAKKLPS